MGSNSFDDASDAEQGSRAEAAASDSGAQPPGSAEPAAAGAGVDFAKGAATGAPVSGAEPIAAQQVAPWERPQAAPVEPNPWQPATGGFGPSGHHVAPGQPVGPAGVGPVPALGYPGPSTPGTAPFGAVPQYPVAPPAPAQMWMPPGRYLTQSTWRKRWKLPVIIGSSVVGVLLAVVAVFAVVFGVISSSVFTARGVVVVSCQSGTALEGLIKPGSAVRIWGENGSLEGSTQLQPMKSVDSDSGSKVCYLPFEVRQVSTSQVGFNVRIGLYSQFVSANALKSGAVLRPTY